MCCVTWNAQVTRYTGTRAWNGSAPNGSAKWYKLSAQRVKFAPCDTMRHHATTLDIFALGGYTQLLPWTSAECVTIMIFHPCSGRCYSANGQLHDFLRHNPFSSLSLQSSSVANNITPSQKIYIEAALEIFENSMTRVFGGKPYQLSSTVVYL